MVAWLGGRLKGSQGFSVQGGLRAQGLRYRGLCNVFVVPVRLFGMALLV